MTAIGEALRAERLARKLDLQQISRELRISSRFLDAIERESFEELPGAIFVKSFVRQYARFLGLDEDELAAAAQRLVEPALDAEEANKGPFVAPVDNVRVPPMRAWGSVGDGGRFRPSSTLPALGLVVVAMLVCSGVYAWWQRARHSPAVPAPPPAVSTNAAPPPALVTVPTAPVPAPPDASQPAAVPPGAAAGAPPASAAQGPSSEPAANAPPTAQTTPAAPPPAVEQPGARGPVRIQVTALTATWVLARSDGKYVFSATLDPNQTRTVEARESVELRLGDAAGVSVALNGKALGALGPKGQVRTVQFNSGGFRIVPVTAAPAPAAPR